MKNLLYFFLSTILLACKTAPDPFEQFLITNGNTFDICIKDGSIIDGSDSSAYAADILIKSEKIIFIGKIDTSKITCSQTIRAQGKTITSGFIDAHAHGNPQNTPDFKNFLAMGVTTICLGQDGSSPAAGLETWTKTVGDLPLGVNIVPFVGHGTLRKQSGINYDIQPSTTQINKMENLLQQAFDAGCFGMTTGLEYTPGTYAGDEELTALAKVVGKNKGLIMSHIRNEDDDKIEESIQELLRQGEFCNVQVSHLKSVYGKGRERANEILSLLKSPNGQGYTVTADVYPYNASYTGIGIVFPDWAKAPYNYQKVKQSRRKELLVFLKEKIQARNGPQATLFGTAPYAGKTLQQVAEAQKRPYEEVLLDIGPTGASGAYFVMDDALQEVLISTPNTMICSDGSPTMRHPRGYGSFAKIIEEYVFNRKTISLEKAIYKMTGLTAQTLGLNNRGLVKVGYIADLLIFDPKKIKANATYPNPHQLAMGFDYVLVNGKVAWQDGKVKESVGKILRKS